MFVHKHKYIIFYNNLIFFVLTLKNVFNAFTLKNAMKLSKANFYILEEGVSIISSICVNHNLAFLVFIYFLEFKGPSPKCFTNIYYIYKYMF